jgi:hypothetical protein
VIILAGAAVGLYFGLFRSPSGPNYQRTLSQQIVSSVSGCSPDKSSQFIVPKDQVGAQIDCNGPSTSSIDLVRYVLFTSSSGFNQAYGNYVKFTANTSFNHGDCKNFVSFSALCETQYNNGGNTANVGRVVEYFNDHRPVMVFTVIAQRILVVMVGAPNDNGDGVAQYFKNHNLVKSE